MRSSRLTETNLVLLPKNALLSIESQHYREPAHGEVEADAALEVQQARCPPPYPWQKRVPAHGVTCAQHAV